MKETLRTLGQKLIRNMDVLLFIIIISTKFLIYGKAINSKYYSFSGLFPPIFASILIIVAFGILFNRKNRVKFFFVLDIIFSFIAFADTIYFSFFNDIISVGAVRNSFLLKDVSSSVVSLLKFRYFLFFIDIILLIPVIILFRKVKSNPVKLSKRIVTAVLVFIVALTLNIKQINGLKAQQPRLLMTMSNKIYIAKVLGSLNFHFLDACNYANTNLGKTKITEERQEEIQTFLSNNAPVSTKLYSGEGKGKNLIIIQVESLQQFVINRSVEGKEVTPNLNKFINRSMYFDNFFYQVADGNTSDAEFMVNNSLYPAPTGAAYYRYSNITYNSLPMNLKQQGYYTAVMHGNNEGFWNRNVMYKSMHFDDFFGANSFDMSDIVGLGLSDKSFFNQAIEKMRSFQKPFYSFFVTLSSHHPFETNNGVFDFNVGNLQGTLLGNYIKAINYTDTQLGMFLDKLEEEGYLDDSIVVIYGDHKALPRENNEFLTYLGIDKNDDFTWNSYQKVPMLIHFPQDNHKGINHTYSGQMDLYPTIANMFDIKTNDTFGKDIFNVNERFIVFRNGSFTDGVYFYNSPTNTYYEMATGEKIEENEKLKNLRDNALQQLSYSDDILSHNLIEKFNSSQVDKK